MEVSELINAITKEANSQGVPPEFALQLFGAENFKGGKIPAKGDVPTDRVSPKAASGVMQVIPSTWQGLIKNGVLPADADPKDPLTNIKAGVAVAKERLAARNGNRAAAAADYNGGLSQGDLVAAGKSPSFPETQRYIANTSGGTQVADPTSSYENTTSPRFSTRVGGFSSGIDTELANTSLTAAIGKNKQVLDLMNAAVGRRGDQFKQIATSAEAAGKAAGDQAQAEGDIEIAKNRNSRSILEALGGDLDPAKVMLQSKIAIEQEQKKQDNLRAQIDPRDAVTIFDDPLQWLVNKFELPTLKKQYNASLATEQTMIARQQQTQAVVTAQQHMDQPLLEETIKQRVNAQRAGAAADAAIKAAQAMATSEQDTVHLLTQTAAINQWDYSSWIQLAAKTAERYQWNDQQTQANDKEKALVRDVINPLNMQLVPLGLPKMTPVAWQQLSPKLREDYMQMVLRPTLGTNPGDSLRMLMETGAVNTIGTAQPVLSRFISQQLTSKEQLEEEKKIRTEDPKAAMLPPDKIQQMAFERVAKNQIEVYNKPLGGGKLPDMSNVPLNHFAKVTLRDVALDEGVAKNPLLPDLQKIIATKPGLPITDTDIVSTVVAKAVADPKQIPLLAQNLAQLYQVGAMSQWSKAAAKMGYPKPVGYGNDAFIQLRGMGIGETVVKTDLMSPAQIEAALTLNVAKEQAKLQGTKLQGGVDMHLLQSMGQPVPGQQIGVPQQ